MIKKIFIILVLLFCITPIVCAKEYKVDIENTVLTFDIPDSYDIIEKDHPNPAVLQKLGVTADEVAQEIKIRNSFFNCLDFDAAIEISFIGKSTEVSKRFGDLKNHKNMVNSQALKDTIIKGLSNSDVEITNIYTKELSDAIYVVLQGNSRELTKYGKYSYVKIFTTYKNATLFIIKGIAWDGERSKLDTSLESVINSMRFTPKGPANSISTSIPLQADNYATNALAAALLVGIAIIIFLLYRKMKEKKNNKNDDVTGDSKAPNNDIVATNEAKQDVNQAGCMSKIDKEDYQHSITIDDLPKLKKMLDDGIITQEDFDKAKKNILG